MANSRPSSVQDKIGDMTTCSICTEIFTNPKILPCVHTFCLHCLETYGKDKQPGVQITCPICRSEFAIPSGGLCNLPNNFFIGNIVEIGKMSVTHVNEVLCNICPEGEELMGKMYCIDCEQILCERCSRSHRKTKFCQSHQVIELGSRLNVQEFNLRNSYCEHHPKQLITMYCTEHSSAICLICCVESHQSHRCINVEKAAGDFTEQLKEDLNKVTKRLAECEEVGRNLDEYKKEFLKEISISEESISDTGTKLKKLIDQHTQVLFQTLKSVTERNLKAVEMTKQDVERFRVMIDSYTRYSDELLSRGSLVDICRAADQMHTRANVLEKLPANCSGERFCFDAVAFYPSVFDSLVKQCSRSDNPVGDLIINESPDRIIKFEVEDAVAASFLRREIVGFKGKHTLDENQEADAVGCGEVGDDNGSAKADLHNPKYVVSSNFNTVKVSGLSKDTSEEMITLYFENKKWSGGGKIKVLDHQKEKGKAVIKFENLEDAMQVCKRTHKLAGVIQTISALEMPLDEVKSCAIEVRGLGERATADLLTLHFENTRRSGGGPVEKVFLNKAEKSAVVVFEEATAVLGVMKKKSHTLHGANLKVNVLEAAPPPPLLTCDVDTKRLVAKRLPPSVTRESLWEYLKQAANAKMVYWTFANKHSTALLDFSSEPG